MVNKGVEAERTGDLTAAIRDYQDAVKKNPLDLYAYYDLGVAYQREGAVADASTAYQKALLINPKYKPALFNLAVLDTPSSPATAVKVYNELQAIDPKDPDVLFNLGLLLRQTGHVSQGNSDIAEAVILDHSLASRIPAGPSSSTGTTSASRTKSAPTS